MALGGLRGLTRPIERVLAAPFIWAKVPPNAITIFTVVPALAAAFFAASGEWFVALAWGAGAAFLDLVDGTVARTTGRVTPLGGVIDSTVDRVVDLLFLFGVGLGLNAAGAWWLVAACAVGAVGTSYVRARAYEFVRPDPSAWRLGFERGERTLVLGLGALGQGAIQTEAVRGIFADASGVGQWPVLVGALALYAVGANLTALVRILTVRRLLRENVRERGT